MTKTPAPRTVIVATFALATLAALPARAQNIPPYKAGFPLTLSGEGTVSFSKPLVADLKITGGKVGVKSIIFGNDKGNLHVIYQRASDNAWLEAPGFPVSVGANTLIYSSPAAGDITGDGIPEIVVGYGNQSGTVPGGVKAFRNNGQLLWTRASLDAGIPDGRPDPVLGTPAIGDVDGDGQNDVVWGSIDFRIYFVAGATGANKPNWPRNAIDTIWSSPVLHDMDGDGRLEIIIGVDAHPDATFGIPSYGGCLHVMPATQPAITGGFPTNVGYPQNLPGFPKCVNQVIFSAPSVGDIDGDGRPDIVHGTGSFFAPPTITPTEAVYAWRCDGTAVSGWPVAISGQVGTSPALGNLDGDAALEVVVTADNTRSSTTHRVYAINGNGSIMPGFPVIPKSFQGTTSAADPVIGDVLGPDGTSEIIVPVIFEATVISSTGVQLTDAGPPHAGGLPSFFTQYSVAGVSVADLDPGDGKIEVVAVSSAPFPAATNGVVHVWNPISRAVTPPWGQFRQGETRRGQAPGTGPCRTYGACAAPPSAPRLFTVTPCRAVDTRGGAALGSGSLRDFELLNVCNVPSTAKALSLNVTVVSPTADGFVRFSPSCTPPLASTINFSPGQTRANNAILQLGSDGILTANTFVSGSGSVHLLIDINGYFQ